MEAASSCLDLVESDFSHVTSTLDRFQQPPVHSDKRNVAVPAWWGGKRSHMR